jgi:hypothetical protein
MKILSLLVLAFLVSLSACTKGKEEPPKGSDGKPMVTRQANPDRVVFETDLVLPKEYQGKVKKTDLMIWDLKDEEGNVVAAQLVPVPKFPHTLTVTGRQLFEPLKETGNLIFTARIVKFGDEGKPPSKGQLQVMVGMGTTEGAEVNNPAVDQKRLDKWMKKQKIVPSEAITLGGKTKAEFTPASM